MLAIRNRIRAEQGFTLVEVTIILLVLVILSMIMLPQLGNFNRLARKVKVLEDLGAICASMKKMLDEVPGLSAFYTLPGDLSNVNNEKVGFLYGPGAIPVDNVTHTNTADLLWGDDDTDPVDTVGEGFSVTTDSPGGAATATGFVADEFDHHLVENSPLGAGLGAGVQYPNNSTDDTIDFFFGWKGPYLNEFTPDPWGNRYMSNVFGLHTNDTNGSYFSTAVVCYSAGPNTVVDTGINQPGDVNPPGWITGGDDFVAVLSSFGPF